MGKKYIALRTMRSLNPRQQEAFLKDMAGQGFQLVRVGEHYLRFDEKEKAVKSYRVVLRNSRYSDDEVSYLEASGFRYLAHYGEYMVFETVSEGFDYYEDEKTRESAIKAVKSIEEKRSKMRMRNAITMAILFILVLVTIMFFTKDINIYVGFISIILLIGMVVLERKETTLLIKEAEHLTLLKEKLINNERPEYKSDFKKSSLFSDAWLYLIEQFIRFAIPILVLLDNSNVF